MKLLNVSLAAILGIFLIAGCVAAESVPDAKPATTEVTKPVEATPVAVAAPAADASKAPGSVTAVGMTPLERVKSTPKGELKNPYTGNEAMIAEGKKRYMSYSCNGCHGGNGGGGMCPPLSNETWVYGDTDDTLFRLITLGSVDLAKDGYTRKGRENVVGPMPAFGTDTLIKTDDDLWKIIAFIRSNWRGSKDRIHW
ncbi:MAG: c-type cytochrome [Methylophilaceae bacterium]|nr:c-type cytochrome [Methylophilaceae bacterium]